MTIIASLSERFRTIQGISEKAAKTPCCLFRDQRLPQPPVQGADGRGHAGNDRKRKAGLITRSNLASARLSSVLNRSSTEGRLKFSALFFAIHQHFLRELGDLASFVVSINALACSADFCGFDCNGNLGTVNFENASIALTQGVCCLSGQIGSPIHQSK